MNGEHSNAPAPVSTEQRAFATEWLPAEVRVVRRGDKFDLEIQTSYGSGSRNLTLEISEQYADELRFLWR